MRALLPVLLLLTPCSGQLFHELSRLRREGVEAPHILFMVPEAPHPVEGGSDVSEEVASSEERRPDQEAVFVPFAEGAGPPALVRLNQRPNYEKAHPLPEHGPPFVQEAPNVPDEPDQGQPKRQPPGVPVSYAGIPGPSPADLPQASIPPHSGSRTTFPKFVVPEPPLDRRFIAEHEPESPTTVVGLPTQQSSGSDRLGPHIIFQIPAPLVPQEVHPHVTKQEVHPVFVSGTPNGPSPGPGIQQAPGEDFIILRIFNDSSQAEQITKTPENGARPSTPGNETELNLPKKQQKQQKQQQQQQQTDKSIDFKEPRIVLPVAEIAESADIVDDLLTQDRDQAQSSGGEEAPSTAFASSSDSVEDSASSGSLGSGSGVAAGNKHALPTEKASVSTVKTLTSTSESPALNSSTGSDLITAPAGVDDKKEPVVVYMSNGPLTPARKTLKEVSTSTIEQTTKTNEAAPMEQASPKPSTLNPEAGSPSELEPVVIIWSDSPTDLSSTSTASTTAPLSAKTVSNTASLSNQQPSDNSSAPVTVERVADPVTLSSLDQTETSSFGKINSTTSASVSTPETLPKTTTTTTTTTTESLQTTTEASSATTASTTAGTTASTTASTTAGTTASTTAGTTATQLSTSSTEFNVGKTTDVGPVADLTRETSEKKTDLLSSAIDANFPTEATEPTAASSTATIPTSTETWTTTATASALTDGTITATNVPSSTADVLSTSPSTVIITTATAAATVQSTMSTVPTSDLVEVSSSIVANATSTTSAPITSDVAEAAETTVFNVTTNIRTDTPASTTASPSPEYVPTETSSPSAAAVELNAPEVTANEISNETANLPGTTTGTTTGTETGTETRTETGTETTTTTTTVAATETDSAKSESPISVEGLERSAQSSSTAATLASSSPSPVTTVVELGPPKYYDLPSEREKPSVFATQTVRTRNGQMKGNVIKTSNGLRVNSFLGIPYAQPPVGAMRFERPMEFPPWTGVFEAKRLPSSCPQPSMQLNGFVALNISETSEDCLYLNIWSPFCDGSKKCRSQPVIVYIHGGGFIHGGSNWPIFDGAELAAKADVVVVSLNYRLGALGFLYVPSNGGRPERANMGLYDQHLALRWVKSNIKAFGGDHNKITIMGQDAGAASVGYHILTPRSTGLFKRAVMQSGSPFSFVLRNTKDQGEILLRSLASYTDCTSVHFNSTLRYDDVLHCMKKLPFESIISASEKFNGKGANSFFPILGEDFIPMNPKDSLILKRFSNVDLLVTTTNSEGAFFLQHFLSPFTNVADPDKIDSGEIVFYLRVFLSALLGGKQTATLNEFTQNTEPETREDKIEFLKNISAVIGDYPFLCATTDFGIEYANLRHNVYHMQYDHRPWFLLHPTWFPSTHGDDIMFWLGSVYKVKERTRGDERVADELIAILTAFAAKGTPQTRGKLTWPRINQGGYYMSVGTEVTELLRNPPANCRYWSRHYPQY